MSEAEFQPWKPLIAGSAHAACRIIVIIPARNEEESLEATLDAFARQVDLDGTPLDPRTSEVLLLLNNCTDNSSHVAAQWQKRHAKIRLHIVERTLAPEQAFVGTARRMLMDTAWRRLAGKRGVCGILSTDSDSLVSDDWITQNMRALAQGADAVGGVIELKPGELEALPSGVRRAYLRDRRYQQLVAKLESRLDPQVCDPWPRHLEHFGASLACTPQAYARAGGMPAVTPLEDVAFMHALLRTGARLRHDPDVKVFTSSRLRGRVEVGLSGQLRIWHKMSVCNDEHRVPSAAWLAHRFRTLAKLRAHTVREGVAPDAYIEEIDCDRIIEETFRGRRDGEITRVNRRLAAMLSK